MACYKIIVNLGEKERRLSELNIIEYVEVEEEDGLAIFFEGEDGLDGQGLECVDVDWGSQSAIHSQYYHNDGLLHYPIDAISELLLLPGASFGDLSHPTTLLMLDMMKKYVKDKFVLDIGSGSGVLSLAASMWGARKVLGIEIDQKAVEHSKENLYLNSLSNVHFEYAYEGYEFNCRPEVILINMISSEQEIAWRSYPQLKEYNNIFIIVSGIMLDQREEYLKTAEQRHWILQSEKENNGWLCFVFHT